jgi:putative endonuclease
MDVAAREAVHNAGKGSKYTRARLPLKIIYHEDHETLSAARKREAEVKKWSKERKEALAAER